MLLWLLSLLLLTMLVMWVLLVVSYLLQTEKLFDGSATAAFGALIWAGYTRLEATMIPSARQQGKTEILRDDWQWRP